jgi:hypothetical protein
MRLSRFALLAAIAYSANVALAVDHLKQFGVQQVGCCETCDTPACGCEAPCEASCGAEEACCDSGCDGCCPAAGCSLFKGCCLCEEGFAVNGWLQLGYHSQGLGTTPRGLSRFNDYPDSVRLHQAYLKGEKVADGSKGLGFGGRVDYVYGIDGPDTQAFGQANGWDTGWDNGGFYGSALPQLYGEVAMGKTSIKAGKFYTIIGYETVTAPDNFFYSHAYTMYNNEPFTHTGVLLTEALSDDLTVWSGYTMGWDSGFSNNGDNFIGGFKAGLTDAIKLTYGCVIGRFNEGGIGGISSLAGGDNERGFMHSIILDVAMTKKLKYIFWHDYIDTDDEDGVNFRDRVALNNYLIYSLTDKVGLGARYEWVQVRDGGLVDADINDFTMGINYKASKNLIIRPECRWDWDQSVAGVGLAHINENNAPSQTTFGVDAILSF